MRTQINELSEIDYEILDYLNRSGTVSKNQILDHFSKSDDIEFRLESLATPIFSKPPLPNKSFWTYGPSYIEEVYEEYQGRSESLSSSTDIYRITGFGRRTLYNYRLQVKSDKRRLWLTNVKIPILVSIATYAILRTLEALLTLMIQQLMK